MFVSQPDGIRTFANLGHSWYLSSIRNLVHPIDGISKKRWIEVYDSIAAKINNAIRDHHGIPCFLDGFMNTSNPNNHVILHFCDVLAIAMRKELRRPMPEVIISSDNFRVVPDTILYAFLNIKSPVKKSIPCISMPIYSIAHLVCGEISLSSIFS